MNVITHELQNMFLISVSECSSVVFFILPRFNSRITLRFNIFLCVFIFTSSLIIIIVYDESSS